MPSRQGFCLKKKHEPRLTSGLTSFSRYKAVSYSSPISVNTGVILSKKPGPASSVFNVVKVRLLYNVLLCRGLD